jgi:CDGSH-type Zn-finger protein
MNEPMPSITTYRSGPYLVRGPVRVIDEDGNVLTIRRAIVPLCRCGRSRTKPLCDGSHGAAPSPSHDDPAAGASTSRIA